MQHSLCKRVAKQFKLQRYIPEYQVYELCINWQSQIPIPPTIFYLSEIFIYPYTKPLELAPDSIKREITSPNKLVESTTFVEKGNESIPHNVNLLKSLSLITASQIEGKAQGPRVLDYEKTSVSRNYPSLIKLRKKEIVRHVPYRTEEAKKRRKI